MWQISELVTVILQNLICGEAKLMEGDWLVNDIVGSN
jgi:hypothetical protein